MPCWWGCVRVGAPSAQVRSAVILGHICFGQNTSETFSGENSRLQTSCTQTDCWECHDVMFFCWDCFISAPLPWNHCGLLRNCVEPILYHCAEKQLESIGLRQLHFTLFTPVWIMRTVCHLQGYIYLKKHLHCWYENGDCNSLVSGGTLCYHLEIVNRTVSWNNWLPNLGEGNTCNKAS